MNQLQLNWLYLYWNNEKCGHFIKFHFKDEIKEKKNTHLNMVDTCNVKINIILKLLFPLPQDELKENSMKIEFFSDESLFVSLSSF